MVERESSKNSFKKVRRNISNIVGCAIPSAILVAGVTFMGYEYVKTTIEQNNAIKIERKVLQEDDLIGPQALISLNQVGSDFGDIQGYFKYLDTKDTQGKNVSMVEFAWRKADGEIIISTASLDNTKAIRDNQSSKVEFSIDPKDSIDEKRKPIISSDPNKFISNPKTLVTFSLSGQDLKNFKGPK